MDRILIFCTDKVVSFEEVDYLSRYLFRGTLELIQILYMLLHIINNVASGARYKGSHLLEA